MKMLRINNKDQVSYCFNEGITKGFLEREYGITKYAILTNITDWTRK